MCTGSGNRRRGDARLPDLWGSWRGRRCLATRPGTRREACRLLYQVQPADPLTLAVVAAVALLTALAASYLPARKAASVEPMKVLREE